MSWVCRSRVCCAVLQCVTVCFVVCVAVWCSVRFAGYGAVLAVRGCANNYNFNVHTHTHTHAHTHTHTHAHTHGARAHTHTQTLAHGTITARCAICSELCQWHRETPSSQTLTCCTAGTCAVPYEYNLFYRSLLQKRPIILRSLLIVATP